MPGADVPAHIYVGRSAETDKLKISDEGLKGGAFRMVSGKDYLVLLGHDKDFILPQYALHNYKDTPEWDARTGEHWRNPNPLADGAANYSRIVGLSQHDEIGTLNAVYEFLRGLGVRWYMPGDLGEIVPELKTIALIPVDKTVKPDFPYRDFGGYAPLFRAGTRDGMLYKLRSGFNSTPIIHYPHGLCGVYWRDEVRKAHPEYYALRRNGQRATGTASANYNDCYTCLSSPEFFDNTVKFARTAFDIYPDLKYLSLMPNDGFYIGQLCQCDLCKGKSTLERGTTSGDLSDYVWDFVERVARELYKTHPDRKVTCCAYSCYALPPLKIAKFSPNVMVGIFVERGLYNEPETRAKALEIRKEWLDKLAPGNLYTYSHNLQSGSHLPAYFPHAIAEDLHSLKGISEGEHTELSWGSIDKVLGATLGDMHAPGFNHLNMYVAMRYYWNADQDIEALLNEYYEKFYGPAAKEMKAFIEYSEANWRRMGAKVEQIDKALELLAAARKAAGDTVYGKRVDLLAEYLQPMKQLHDKLVTRIKDVPRAVTVERKSAALKLDGKLDEAFWKDVPVYELKDDVSGQPPTNKTTFQVVWGDDETVVFGIRCEDADMKNLNITTRKNDDYGMWPCDVAEIFLETQEHVYYQIAINPVGAVADIDHTGKGPNLAWSSCAEYAAYVGDTFWSVELRIPTFDWTKMGRDPLKKVEGKKPTDTAPWFFNVCRERVRGDAKENSAFSPTGGRFLQPMKFGVLIVK